MWLMAFPRAGAAQALQEIRIGSSVIGFSSLMSYCTRDLKFFEREALDAKIIYAQTNVGLAALTAGNFDYSNLTTSAVEATLRGMPLRLIAVTNAEPLWGIVVRKDITKISELKGKKLGVSSFGGTSYSAALYVLKHFGLRSNEDSDSSGNRRNNGAHRRAEARVGGCRRHSSAGRHEGGARRF
jgi:ABC-type nitrate/sulfonate/bicarbonate transport system substrate-binding protein